MYIGKTESFISDHVSQAFWKVLVFLLQWLLLLKSLVGDYDRYGLCSNQTPNGSTEKRFRIDAHSFWSYPIKSFLGWSQPMRDQSKQINLKSWLNMMCVMIQLSNVQKIQISIIFSHEDQTDRQNLKFYSNRIFIF